MSIIDIDHAYPPPKFSAGTTKHKHQKHSKIMKKFKGMLHSQF